MVPGFPPAPPRHHRPPPLRPVLPVRVVPFATDQTGGPPPGDASPPTPPPPSSSRRRLPSVTIPTSLTYSLTT
ncbi:hypothetical protein Hanom_Chr17g01548461 [Helianthus anomalus]